jgi:antirestriction protein ArdC
LRNDKRAIFAAAAHAQRAVDYLHGLSSEALAKDGLQESAGDAVAA